MFPEYDVIVVGAGHAGCEAAHAAATMGSRVMLVTMNMMTIAQMSCNPAMGGIAKGQIIREIDALGGMSGIISDQSMIQFRMLNKSKGPAMWSPRSQNDRMLFAKYWREALEKNPNIDLWQDMVSRLLVKDGRVCGVRTGLGMEIQSRSVVLTNGTFLNGLIHIGEKTFGGGRTAEKAATGITEQLIDLGFDAGRMKTGTPPRLDGRTIRYDAMEEQKGDENPGTFSFSDTQAPAIQRSCYITYTDQHVHSILRTGFEQSPMFTGRIQGVGPRYCPSIEDKIERFADKNRHQLFVEPEGWDTVEVYVNGFSTSLPEAVQFQALRKIKGFEQVKMFRPGYAIEYDYFPPTQLKLSLETKLIENLYFAGQINGTTGYEETLGHNVGLASEARMQRVKQKEADIQQLLFELKKKKLKPSEINSFLESHQSNTIKESKSVFQLLQRPELGMAQLQTFGKGVGDIIEAFDEETVEQAEINTIYQSYIEKERKLAEKVEHLEHYKIRDSFDYTQIKALSAEAIEKLTKMRPATIGQASRISGVSPADISVMMVYLAR
jgi:tRNA uridine 5-carboxymethylaminomethyl modification enzyme